jgi:hypothetical protein
VDCLQTANRFLENSSFHFFCSAKQLNLGLGFNKRFMVMVEKLKQVFHSVFKTKSKKKEYTLKRFLVTPSLHLPDILLVFISFA